MTSWHRKCEQYTNNRRGVTRFASRSSACFSNSPVMTMAEAVRRHLLVRATSTIIFAVAWVKLVSFRMVAPSFVTTVRPLRSTNFVHSHGPRVERTAQQRTFRSDVDFLSGLLLLLRVGGLTHVSERPLHSGHKGDGYLDRNPRHRLRARSGTQEDVATLGDFSVKDELATSGNQQGGSVSNSTLRCSPSQQRR